MYRMVMVEGRMIHLASAKDSTGSISLGLNTKLRSLGLIS